VVANAWRKREHRNRPRVSPGYPARKISPPLNQASWFSEHHTTHICLVLVFVLYFRAVRSVLIISLRVRYCAALTKGRLSDYSYRGKELAGFNFLDFLVGTSEFDMAENKRDSRPMSAQWTMTNRVGHETHEPRTNPCLWHAFNTHPQNGVCHDGLWKPKDLQRRSIEVT